MVNDNADPGSLLGFDAFDSHPTPSSPDLANLSHQLANVEVAESPFLPRLINFTDDLEDSDATPTPSAQSTPASTTSSSSRDGFPSSHRRDLGFHLGLARRRRTASPVPKPRFSEATENGPHPAQQKQKGGGKRYEALELTPIRAPVKRTVLEIASPRGLAVRQRSPSNTQLTFHSRSWGACVEEEEEEGGEVEGEGRDENDTAAANTEPAEEHSIPLSAASAVRPQAGRKRSYSQSHQAGRRHRKHYRSDSCPPEPSHSLSFRRPHALSLPRSSLAVTEISEADEQDLIMEAEEERTEAGHSLQSCSERRELLQSRASSFSSFSSISSSSSQQALPPQAPRSFSISSGQSVGVDIARRRQHSLRPASRSGSLGGRRSSSSSSGSFLSHGGRQVRSQTLSTRSIGGQLRLSRSQSWVGTEIGTWLPIPERCSSTSGRGSPRGELFPAAPGSPLLHSPASSTTLSPSPPSMRRHREWLETPVPRLKDMASIEVQIQQIQSVVQREAEGSADNNTSRCGSSNSSHSDGDRMETEAEAQDPVSVELSSRKIIRVISVPEEEEEEGAVAGGSSGLGRSYSSVFHAQTARATAGSSFFASDFPQELGFSMSQPSSRAASPLILSDSSGSQPTILSAPSPPTLPDSHHTVLSRSLSVASSVHPPRYSRKTMPCSGVGRSHGPAGRAPLRRTAEEVDRIQKEQKPCLPHQVVKCCVAITADTMARLMEGHYNGVLDKFIVIDCRYEFEYRGGHIVGAINMTDRRQFEEFFKANWESNERVAIILHCEFSQVRGVKAWEFLRHLDRNKLVWPKLCLPQLYLLKDGYKQFYEKYSQLCTPRGYTPMLDKRFEEECRAAQRHRRVDWDSRRRGSRAQF